MNGIESQFIYQPNTFLGAMLLIALLASIAKPQILTVLAIGILLIRPNERMDLSIPIVQVIVPILLFVIIINSKKLLLCLNDNVNKYLFLFIALIVTQTLIYNPSDIISNTIWVISGLLLYCLIIVFMDDDRGIKWLCYAIVVSCFIICYEPVYYHYTEVEGSELWNFFHLEKSGRLQAWGMWANANETAFLACLGVANLLFITYKCKYKYLYIISAFLTPFFILVVFLTASRAGLASLLLIFIPFIVFVRQTSLKIFIILLIMCVSAVSQFIIPTRSDAEGSFEERLDLRYRGKQLIFENPLMGLGLNKSKYELGSKSIHNTYVQAFAETGIIGGILFVAYFYNLGRKVYVNYTNSRNYSLNRHMIIYAGLYCSTIFYLYWGNQLLTILFFLIIAQITTSVNNCDAVMKSGKGIFT